MGVYGGLRSAKWLRSFRQAPMVTAFRNLESGQVLFTQTMNPQQYYIDQQFKWPNWQNKKPTLRKDIWRLLAVAEMPTWEHSVQLYKNLVELRHRRDMYERKQARDWRRKSPEGNIWYWNQYRPTYTYEAVADLISSIAALNPESAAARLHWDAEYRRGGDDAWADLNVEHSVIPRHNPREQFVVLNAIRQDALVRATQLRADMTRRTQEEAAAARAAGQPTHAEQARAARETALERRKRVHTARLAAKERLLASRPDLQQLADRGETVRRALLALRAAQAEFDPFTPRGQRGAAKQPIKLRERALRQAKRAYRDLKRRISARSKKRRVPQPQVRMRAGGL